MIDYDEIRKQVAMEHNFLIAKDDPILVSVTLNELVFQRYVDILEEKNLAHRKAIEAALQKGIADAKVTAGSVITQAADYVSEQAHTAVTAALNECEVKVTVADSKVPKESGYGLLAALYAPWAIILLGMGLYWVIVP